MKDVAVLPACAPAPPPSEVLSWLLLLNYVFDLSLIWFYECGGNYSGCCGGKDCWCTTVVEFNLACGGKMKASYKESAVSYSLCGDCPSIIMIYLIFILINE